MSVTKRVEVLFEPERYRAMEKLARDRGETVGALVREAVDRQYFPDDAERRRSGAQKILSAHSDLTWEEAKQILDNDVGRRF